ncbi:TetR/AcrR family transcriptional regulator [Pseudomonas graminis]
MAGRPREFDRQTALVQARDLFWRHGYEGTSMSDLVAALGIASARIYKAFGSKEQLFREAIGHYEQQEGGFAERALQHPEIQVAIREMLKQAVHLFARPDAPLGCMVVSATGALSDDHSLLSEWLMQQRTRRTQGIVERMQQAAEAGQLIAGTEAENLGNYYATVLHGLSVQARDGVSREALYRVVECSLLLLQSALRLPR